MNRTSQPKDLVILASDNNMRFAIQGILSRPESLKIQPIDFEIFVHPHHDPGCLLKGPDFLCRLSNNYDYALIALDRQGCGREALNREKLEKQIEQGLSESGWRDRASAIVIDPELENWVWSDSPHVPEVLGWKNQEMDLKTWLISNDLLKPDSLKPHRPKEAMEKVIRIAGKPRSSSLYQQLARKVSFERCTDPAFLKLKKILRKWFRES